MLLLAQALALLGARADISPDGTSYVLTNGRTLPLVGFGVGNLPHEQLPSVVAAAVSSGGRFVDTAGASRNERALVAAIGASGVDGALGEVGV